MLHIYIVIDIDTHFQLGHRLESAHLNVFQFEDCLCPLWVRIVANVGKCVRFKRYWTFANNHTKWTNNWCRCWIEFKAYLGSDRDNKWWRQRWQRQQHSLHNSFEFVSVWAKEKTHCSSNKRWTKFPNLLMFPTRKFNRKLLWVNSECDVRMLHSLAVSVRAFDCYLLYDMVVYEWVVERQIVRK